MKATKKSIRENTRSAEVVGTGELKRKFNHFYKHNKNEAFELSYQNPAVFHNVGPNSYLIGEATTKKQFIDVVYDYLNS